MYAKISIEIDNGLTKRPERNIICYIFQSHLFCIMMAI